MFMDMRQLQNGKKFNFDICIIGSGAAGISIAKEFINRKESVCLLESGGLDFESDTQGLYHGENTGLPYFPLMCSRLRYFGGTTNHWGGFCRPYEDYYFSRRDWIPDSGWPVRLDDINPYYKRAAKILGIKQFNWNAEYWLKLADLPPLPITEDIFENHIVQLRPARMGKMYKKELENANNIEILMNGNATYLDTDDNARSVNSVNVATLNNKKFSITANSFILATGGIENPRLLLLSDKVQKQGLGNKYDLVGRYFMEHPRILAGIIEPADNRLPANLYHGGLKVNKNRINVQLSIPEEIQKINKMVGITIGLSIAPEDEYKQSHNSIGSISLRHILQEIRSLKFPDHLDAHLSKIVGNFGKVTHSLYEDLVHDQFPIKQIRCFTRIESAPIPESRVILSDKLDQLGVRRADLNWQLSDLDKHSVRKSMEILGIEVAKKGIGRLKSMVSDDNSWPDDLEGGWHHMGTTRMSDNPGKGVVDKNCKVYGVDNLYIAGSSVFPTPGPGTPTFTIIAMAIRLADHLKKKALHHNE